jgi:hypothetical protein
VYVGIVVFRHGSDNRSAMESNFRPRRPEASPFDWADGSISFNAEFRVVTHLLDTGVEVNLNMLVVATPCSTYDSIAAASVAC